MKKGTLALVLACLCVMPAFGQKSSKKRVIPSEVTAGKAARPIYPIDIITSTIKRNDDGDLRIYFYITNKGEKTVSKIVADWVSRDVMEPKSGKFFRFISDDNLEIAPGVSEYVADDLITDHSPTACRGYTMAKLDENKTNSNYLFIPADCTRRQISIVVTEIQYSDGSMWKPTSEAK